ncbi:Uncharacterised protein [Mycobacterium tuberculosis]|uniref:Uncharacterized protein n=1 Tax=Mycobacterium tuberculosis TaxID=1773 RepID=A0A655JD34_MYCTX|nr:Uncharacterised protein [Mycobacterium tuberculosis]CFR67340.1 Uncharacterised protein [Mycobacterium tuberculosis]COW74380.1 Uncharacterised protein [Mycobacterium tuberculosis]SGO28055.1 Uncharacterised protein [Mycobacterium tuberculosis]
MRAPVSSATFRIRSSSSRRATALPYDGKLGPGQSTSTSPPKPLIRNPRCRMWSASHLPSPSWCSSATARGVSPSPQGLSRGKVAVSMTRTSRPARAAQAAAADPAGPAPTTTTSALSSTLTSMLVE